MLNSLEGSAFFSDDLRAQLLDLGLSTSPRPAIAALMLAPLLELSRDDRVTSPSEFEAIQKYLRRLEEEFELATRDQIEEIGTDMGMLPMVQGSWNRARFEKARLALAMILDKLPEEEAHEIRTAVAEGCLRVALAEGGHFISLHRVSSDEQPLIARIIDSLKLDRTAEGLHLLERAGLR